MRIGTRRLRAVLRLFAELFDPQWARELEAELRWLAYQLGAVRDLDVLRERLREATPSEHRLLLRQMQTVLGKRHRAAQQAMIESLKNERFGELIERLKAAKLSAPTTIEALGNASDVLTPRLHAAREKLVRLGNKLSRNDDSLKYHHVRKSAKRVRYVQEALVVTLDKPGRIEALRLIKQLKKLQDVLGELQDSVVARETFKLMLKKEKFHGPLRSAIRKLQSSQSRSEKKARKKFPAVWAKLK